MKEAQPGSTWLDRGRILQYSARCMRQLVSSIVLNHCESIGVPGAAPPFAQHCPTGFACAKLVVSAV